MNIKKIAFLDRDGVINRKALPQEYITKVSDFVFNDGIFELFSNLEKQGYECIIITNQRGIARKKLSEIDLHSIHAFMLEELARRNITVLDVFYCPHDLNSCECRKPAAGMLIKAHEKYQIDTANSILISDSPEDVIMGEKFGIGTNYLIQTDIIDLKL